MAYSTLSSMPRPFVLVPRFASGWSTGMLAYGSAIWGYNSTADAVAAVVASSFFTDGYTLGMRVFDHMLFVDANSKLNSLLLVTSVTSAGNDPRGATVSTVLTT